MPKLLRLDAGLLERQPSPDTFRDPEVRAVARELEARGYELRELRGRFVVACRDGRVCFACDEPVLVRKGNLIRLDCRYLNVITWDNHPSLLASDPCRVVSGPVPAVS